MNNFTYKSKYETYTECYFRAGKYSNDNLALEIWSATEGPITKVTVNPDVKIPSDKIAIKDYSENEGMVDFLISQGIIEETPTTTIPSGWVTIPVYSLTNLGKKIFSN